MMNLHSINPIDYHFMRRCIQLARHAEGRTSPNPMVGAIIVQEGLVLAEGWHEGPGLPHAEVDALRKLGGIAEGATLYVNLEPCCHFGRTPPCTNAVLASGVRRVVAGMVDPNPLVGGRGLEILERAGIEVIVGVEEHLCRELNADFVRAHAVSHPPHVTRGRPRRASSIGR